MTCLVPLSVFAGLSVAAQEEGGRRIFAEEFQTLHRLIKPQDGEFAWYDEIPWMTRVQPARAKAAAEGKPLLLWTSADGQPCGAG